jgi:hypothetical protein
MRREQKWFGSIALLAATVAIASSCRHDDSAAPTEERPATTTKAADQVPPVDPDSVEVTDYHAPAAAPDEVLPDDTLESKAPRFDPALVDRRPLEGWQLNLSDSVLRLDVPLVRPDVEPGLLMLSPSYAATMAAATQMGGTVLPSVNMIDGKAKQFDDGLYAAIDQAYYKGLDRTLLSHVTIVKRLHEKVGPASPASPYLAAGLELAGEKVETGSPGEKEKRLRAFLADPLQSKPIGFYDWTSALSDCFRFLRYFQQPLSAADAPIANALSQVLREDRALLADYQRAIAFYAKLTNPPRTRSLADFETRSPGPISVFPSSTSREEELFERLFPGGAAPEGADLMRSLIREIRSGKLSLEPGPRSGWYEYQVYALETLLLPERGAEHDKLLLTRSYKKRMFDAFKALITKRRETHARLFPPSATAEAAPREVDVEPRLRLEPCPTYYLRTARAYAFLAHFLESTLGTPGLNTLHGLREGKEQRQSLGDELADQRDLFYGLYLLSAEDIGLKPALASDEHIDRARCERLASEWLPRTQADPDLARDTRVSIPIRYDVKRNVTRLWVTLGVRLTRLNASYVRPPRIKPIKGNGDWNAVTDHRLRGASYLIAVDEFAEVELKGPRVFTRKELRALCDRYTTKEAIVQALEK